WVNTRRETPQEAEGTTECYATSDPEAGYCTTAVASGNRRVSWRKSNPKDVQFASEKFQNLLRFSCGAFDAVQVRKWNVRNVGVHYHCIFPAGSELSGLHLWIKNAPLGTYLSVFSEEYLNDPPYDFDVTLKKQGTTLE